MSDSHPATGPRPDHLDGGPEEPGWRALVIGLGGFLLGILPLIVTAVATGLREAELHGRFRFGIELFASDHWAQFSALVMAAAFTALGLQLHRARRGPLAATPALFVVGVGLLLLVVPALLALPDGAPSSQGGALLALYVAYAAVTFWLLNSRSVPVFTVGVGALFQPATNWWAA